jgi:hypothetical protein
VGPQFEACHVVASDPVGSEQLINQHAGAGADFPFGDVQPAQIGGADRTMGITGGDQQALFTPP